MVSTEGFTESNLIKIKYKRIGIIKLLYTSLSVPLQKSGSLAKSEKTFTIRKLNHFH